MARFQDLPAEIKQCILRILFENTVVVHQYASKTLPEENLLAIAAVSKELFTRREVVDAMLKFATFRVFALGELARVRSLDSSQKALIRRMRARAHYGRGKFDYDGSGLRILQDRFNHAYKHLSGLREFVVTGGIHCIDFRAEESTVLITELEDQEDRLSCESFKYFQDADCAVDHVAQVKAKGQSHYTLSDFENALRNGHFIDRDWVPQNSRYKIDDRVFRGPERLGKFLLYAPERGTTVVIDFEMNVTFKGTSSECDCYIRCPTVHFSTGTMAITIPYGEKTISVPQIFRKREGLPPAWPRT